MLGPAYNGGYLGNRVPAKADACLRSYGKFMIKVKPDVKCTVFRGSISIMTGKKMEGNEQPKRL